MDLSNRNIGYGITGSFCTFAKTRKEIQRLTEMGAHVIPIFSIRRRTVIRGLERRKSLWKKSVT